MLQSFRGTFKNGCLLSLRLEDGDSPQAPNHADVSEFWAVMNFDEIACINQAIAAGQRQQALKLVCERSISIGRVLN